jgi:aminoglycoside phosphotransferase (APT) family kinase protein
VLTVTDDVVHIDFTAANVLGADGEITGVIDWGGTRSGDRMFDLATWLYYSPRTCRDELVPLVVDRIGQRGLSVYIAHLAIRQAEWSVRLHGDEAGWAMVRYGLELARVFP